MLHTLEVDLKFKVIWVTLLNGYQNLSTDFHVQNACDLSEIYIRETFFLIRRQLQTPVENYMFFPLSKNYFNLSGFIHN